MFFFEKLSRDIGHAIPKAIPQRGESPRTSFPDLDRHAMIEELLNLPEIRRRGLQSAVKAFISRLGTMNHPPEAEIRRKFQEHLHDLVTIPRLMRSGRISFLGSAWSHLRVPTSRIPTPNIQWSRAIICSAYVGWFGGDLRFPSWRPTRQDRTCPLGHRLKRPRKNNSRWTSAVWTNSRPHVISTKSRNLRQRICPTCVL